MRQIGPLYFSRRTPVITPEQSEAIVGALRGIGLVGEDGMLTADPSDSEVSASRAAGALYALRAAASLQARSPRSPARPANLLWCPPPTHLPNRLQTEGLPSYRWEARLRAALPWLAHDSHALNLNFRTSLIHQALFVAYGR